jgi:HEAT repeat protein
VNALAEELQDKHDTSVRRAAASSLVTVAQRATAAVPALSAAMQDRDRGVRENCARALAAIGPAARKAVPALAAALHTPDLYERFDVVRAIAEIDPANSLPVPYLIGYLKDRRLGAQIKALPALVFAVSKPLACGSFDDEVISSIRESYRDLQLARMAPLRRYAAFTLGRMEMRVAYTALDALSEACSDPDPELRSTAAKAIQHLHSKRR